MTLIVLESYFLSICVAKSHVQSWALGVVKECKFIFVLKPFIGKIFYCKSGF